jgi:uncharacterized repeat protein (TIGR01451 family)
MAVLGAFGATPATAHLSPADCNTNGLALDLVKSRTFVRPGDVVTYTVNVGNSATGACDLTGVTIALQLPAADGTATGQVVTLESGVDLPAGTALRLSGTVNYTVAINPGVDTLIAEARANGVLHDNPIRDDAASITKSVSTFASQPALAVVVTPSVPSGPTPLPVTYTYTVTNPSQTNTPIQNPVVTDDRCATPVYVSGDADGDGAIDTNETWTYTCTTTFTTPGTFPSTVTVTGTNTLDLLPVTSPPAAATVTAAAPSAPDADNSGPAVNSPSTPSRAEVLGRRLAPPDSRRARGDARCISTPTRLSIRARERTVVRVRVREDGAAAETALVRVLGPGISRRKVTNANGVATFRVRAERSGTLVIQSDRCLGADRVTVRRARQVTNDQVPRGTG